MDRSGFMKKLCVSQSLVEVEAWAAVLDVQGIRCFVKHRQGASLAGEVPFAEVFPELWVDDCDWPRADQALTAHRTVAPGGRPWTCDGCGEAHEAAFTACWRCGRLSINLESSV